MSVRRQGRKHAMQPVPHVTPADVERVVRRDFPATQFDGVMAVLKEYGNESWQHEETRVRLAVLKLAAGDSQRLQEHMHIARCDYRDVLSAAEYPRYAREVPPGREPPHEALTRIVEADWAQYQAWLNRREDA